MLNEILGNNESLLYKMEKNPGFRRFLKKILFFCFKKFLTKFLVIFQKKKSIRSFFNFYIFSPEAQTQSRIKSKKKTSAFVFGA